LESLGQVQGRFVQRQAMARGPEIQHIPLERTIRLEAPKEVLAQMDTDSDEEGKD